MVKYCPCELKFKSKVGGVRANEPFTVSIEGEAGEATLVLTKEGEGHTPVFYGMRKTERGFAVELIITTTGLYFYYFLVDGIRYGADRLLNLTQGGEDFLQLVFDGEFRSLNGGVIYQIMPDRFFIGGKPRIKSGAIFQQDWYACPSYLPDGQGKYNNEFFGGNLSGVTEKLDYLKELGVTHIYLNPIFESPSNHRYDTGDYEKIDYILGDEADFDALVLQARRRGIGVILDGVFSHTGADSKYFNLYGNYGTVGAYQSRQSEFFGWYNFDDYPNEYKSWWGFKTLPEVNETSPSYLDYMLKDGGVVDKWESKGICGWRLDVADELPDEFLEKLRAKSKGVLIGEVWENAARKFSYGHRRGYLLGSQLDGVTNYPIKNAIIDFVLSGNNTLLRQTVREQISDYPREAFGSMMNVLGTHDTERILTALSKDCKPQSKKQKAEYRQADTDEATKRLMLASLIQFVLPGVPCIFYGDEAGLSGHEDPFCRKCYPWGRENAMLIEHYKSLGKIRREYASAFGGHTVDLSPNDEVLRLVRTDGKVSVTLTVNFGSEVISLGEQVIFGKSEVSRFEAALTVRYD